jgi:hypothetical protein
MFIEEFLIEKVRTPDIENIQKVHKRPKQVQYRPGGGIL